MEALQTMLPRVLESNDEDVSDPAPRLAPSRVDVADQEEELHYSGVFPSQSLEEAIENGQIQALEDIRDEQIQPASLDLRLGRVGYRVPTSFLPGKYCTVAQKIEALSTHSFEIGDGAVLEEGCVYIIQLMEFLDLRRNMTARANPKSSTGRLDVFARLITDHGEEFDKVRAGYHGPLYAEISPRTFSVRVQEGASLLQMRVIQGVPPKMDTSEIRGQENGRQKQTRKRKENWMSFSADLFGGDDDEIIGYRARKHAGLIDISKVDYYGVNEYWEPFGARPDRSLVLEPGTFYILASKETVSVPPDQAAEMVAYDTAVGEMRVHHAGFFDPGFGHDEAGGAGSRAVLEVRSHEVPFLIEDGQVMGRLVYERLRARPDKIYGQGIGSHYQSQGLMLSKHFKRPAA